MESKARFFSWLKLVTLVERMNENSENFCKLEMFPGNRWWHCVAWMSQEVSKWLGNGWFHLLINGLHWGGNPCTFIRRFLLGLDDLWRWISSLSDGFVDFAANLFFHFFFHTGVSLNGGTPKTPQNWSFLVGKPMVVGYHHFRNPPYILPPNQKDKMFNKTLNTTWGSTTRQNASAETWRLFVYVGWRAIH